MNDSDFNATISPTTKTDIDDDNRPASGWSDRDSPFDNQVFIKLIFGLIAVTGIIGNFLVVFTVIRVPKFRTITNVFITSLASCDFVSSVFILVLHIGIEIPIPSGIGGKVMCALLLSKWPLWSSFIVSSLNLTCVTFERYFSICRPLQYNSFFTHQKAILMSIGAWILGYLIKSYQTWVVKYDGTSCPVYWSSVAYKTSMGILNTFSLYVIPLTTMAITYGLIMKSLKQSAKSVSASSGKASQASLELLKARKKVIKMLVIVVFVFALCWAPNQTIFMSYTFGVNVDFSSWYYHTSVIIAFCNSCLNPLIYAFKMKSYRKSLKIAICGANFVGPSDDDTIATVDVHD
ncbi:somatostatin receptor type 4-like [Amphiura filiformis]|uniref:somatostatin receptor type 4-like n=1 Tax=Amphiura filiformis TaxID=82378 RepID=UPI003B2239CE